MGRRIPWVLRWSLASAEYCAGDAARCSMWRGRAAARGTSVGEVKHVSQARSSHHSDRMTLSAARGLQKKNARGPEKNARWLQRSLEKRLFFHSWQALQPRAFFFLRPACCRASHNETPPTVQQLTFRSLVGSVPLESLECVIGPWRARVRSQVGREVGNVFVCVTRETFTLLGNANAHALT